MRGDNSDAAQSFGVEHDVKMWYESHRSSFVKDVSACRAFLRSAVGQKPQILQTVSKGSYLDRFSLCLRYTLAERMSISFEK